MRRDKIGIDADTNARRVRDSHRAVLGQIEGPLGNAPRQPALADVEFEVTGARQRGDELEAIAIQQVGEPGMWHQIDAGLVGQASHLSGDGYTAAAGEIRLDYVHATLPNEALEI